MPTMDSIFVQVPERPRAGWPRSFCRTVRHLVAGRGTVIVFRLSETTLLVPAVATALIQCAREAVDHDAAVALVAPSAQHRVLLEVMRLAGVLPVFSSDEAARAFFGAPPGQESGVAAPEDTPDPQVRDEMR